MSAAVYTSDPVLELDPAALSEADFRLCRTLDRVRSALPKGCHLSAFDFGGLSLQADHLPSLDAVTASILSELGIAAKEARWPIVSVNGKTGEVTVPWTWLRDLGCLPGAWYGDDRPQRNYRARLPSGTAVGGVERRGEVTK